MVWMFIAQIICQSNFQKKNLFSGVLRRIIFTLKFTMYVFPRSVHPFFSTGIQIDQATVSIDIGGGIDPRLMSYSTFVTNYNFVRFCST